MANKGYKCPDCGGTLEFNIKEQKLKCPYCDGVFEIEDFADSQEDKKSAESAKKSGGESDDANVDLNFDTDAGSQWGTGEEDGLIVFSCEACGGEIVGDQNMTTTRCPYCDTVMVRKDHLKGALRPDYVIPFKLEKKRAKEEFAKHLLGKKLIDESFVNENKIDEIKGVYVPFWLFDVSVDADLLYEDVKEKTYRDGDYLVTEKDYYDIDMAGSVGFDTIPVDGSSKMADDLMESIEPFDFSEAVPFETAYLAGYMADKYDVTIEDSKDNIKRRVKGSAISVFGQNLPPKHIGAIYQSGSIRLKDSKAMYALYPVWMLTAKHEDKIYTYAMNGQTGKFVGDTLPEDKSKTSKMRWSTIGIFTAIGIALGVAAGFIV